MRRKVHDFFSSETHEIGGPQRGTRIGLSEYELLDRTRKTLVKQVGDGSIIKRFDMTPVPRTSTDIVCPHFLEFKWALGCPYDCAWCYLKGSLRHYSRGKSFTPKSRLTIREHLMALFRAESRGNEVLNSGEVADSLADEQFGVPFSKFIIPIFETQSRYKLLLLTKSNNVGNLLNISPHRQVIVSFSVNSIPVAKRWERAPSVLDRLEAAKKVFDVGYETRIRIDPVVPYPTDWQPHYKTLVDEIFARFYPERITLGSLRGLQSTINEAQDKSWVGFLEEPSRWGRRIRFDRRRETFRVIKDYLEEQYSYDKIALCKEPVATWRSLGMGWRGCRCNCLW
jgi:spore photoproduct lyase